MKNLAVTEDAARRIVELGTVGEYVCAQFLDPPELATDIDENEFEYRAGEGIAIADRSISNVGVLSIGVPNDDRRSGNVSFNDEHFTWSRSNVTGEYGVSIRSDVLRSPKITASVADNALTLILEC